ncbi:restriction endonuclease subunit S [Bacillus toyonensis]|uniref:restriction endonuclease subunit S n=1 Tax=Bacillus TaxID=1386 RepID=UPI0003C33903|nr:restriction endonuclease subunit S [Bacillus toyonensis]AHA09487.1 Type I restriction-modification system, specificity subunit S [Bacillus toyonensis BCT-7112]KMP61297.1 hypothetical protein TU60_04700 [Bacillus toyonensis]MBG9609081.1 hypothetical protein [Bacillus toyonensis]MBG9846886.1 hypothetical protein [Bacillus toyonensis]MBG9848325.1 hypothetical protein [Bacillus toyonensis]
MKNKRTPDIRFQESTENWKQCKIVDLSEETFGGGTPKTTIKEYWNGEIPWIQSSDLHEHQVSDVFAKKKIAEKGLQNSATKLIPKNSIAIVTRVGVGKIALMQFEYATSQDFLSLSNLKVNEWFGVYSLYNKLQKELHNVQGTSIKGITKNELLDKKINIPTNLEEQNKIGIFFKNLDQTITLHHQELDVLKQTKQGFLQKMFPKEGKSVPEIRFPGFTGEWEQRNLGDCISYIKGFAFKSEDYKSEGVRLVRVSDLSSNEIKFDNEKIFLDREYENDYTKYKLNIGDIIITTVGSKIELKESAVGRPIIVNNENEGLLNQNLVKISPLNGYNSYFIYQNLLQKRYMNYIGSIERGNANQANIAISDLWLYKVYLTSNEEQKQIGNFFKQLDDTITLRQRELDALKEMKKAFLQKMFV